MHWLSKPGMKMPIHTKVWTKLLSHSNEVLLATLNKATKLYLLLVLFNKQVKSEQNTPQVQKRSSQKLKLPYWKDVKSKWAAKASFFLQFYHHDLTVILGAKGLLTLIASNFLIKMTGPQNIKMKERCFASWSSYQKYTSKSGDLEHLK